MFFPLIHRRIRYLKRIGTDPVYIGVPRIVISSLVRRIPQPYTIGNTLLCKYIMNVAPRRYKIRSLCRGVSAFAERDGVGTAIHLPEDPEKYRGSISFNSPGSCLDDGVFMTFRYI